MEPERINTIINKAWFTVRDQFIANIPAGEARDIASRAVGYYEAEIVSQLRNRDVGKRSNMLYYIAMHDAGRSVLIAGPYDTEEAAESSRRAAEEKAYEYDAKSWFYTSSLVKSEATMKTAFGRV